MDEKVSFSALSTNQITDVKLGEVKFAKFHAFNFRNIRIYIVSLETISNIEIGYIFLNLHWGARKLHDFADWKLWSSQSPLAYSSASQELKYNE